MNFYTFSRSAFQNESNDILNLGSIIVPYNDIEYPILNIINFDWEGS